MRNLATALSLLHHYETEAYEFDDNINPELLLSIADRIESEGLTESIQHEIKTTVPGVVSIETNAETGEVTLESQWGTFVAAGVLVLGALLAIIGFMRSRAESDKAAKVSKFLNEVQFELIKTSNDLNNLIPKEKMAEFEKQLEHIKSKAAAYHNTTSDVSKDKVLSYYKASKRGGKVPSIIKEMEHMAVTSLEEALRTLKWLSNAAKHVTSGQSSFDGSDAKIVFIEAVSNKYDTLVDSLINQNIPTNQNQVNGYVNIIVDDSNGYTDLLNGLKDMASPSTMTTDSWKRTYAKLVADIEKELKASSDIKIPDSIKSHYRNIVKRIETLVRNVGRGKFYFDVHMSLQAALTQRSRKIMNEASKVAETAKASIDRQEKEKWGDSEEARFLKGRHPLDLSHDEFDEFMNRFGKTVNTKPDLKSAHITLESQFFYDMNASVSSMLSEELSPSIDTYPLDAEIVGVDTTLAEYSGAIHSLETVTDQIIASNTVSREQIEQVIKHHGEFLPPAYPLKSFTTHQTAQNTDVVINALALKKTPMLVALINNSAKAIRVTQEHLTSNALKPLVDAMVSTSMSANETLAEVVDYEIIAATLFARFDVILEETELAKPISMELHPMAFSSFTKMLYQTKRNCIDQLDNCLTVAQSLLSAVETLSDKTQSIAAYGDWANAKIHRLPYEGDVPADVRKLQETLSSLNVTEVEEGVAKATRWWPLGVTEVEEVRDTLRSQIIQSKGWFEAVMQSLTLDFIVPEELVSLDDHVTMASFDKLIKQLESLTLTGKKPLYLITDEITSFTDKVRSLATSYLKLTQLTKASMVVYTELVCDKAAVVKVLFEQKDKLIAQKEINILANLIQSAVTK